MKPLPETIGPYRLLELLGEGSMGVVYLAEQREPLRRRVALKLLKPGFESGEVLARFEAERQALALMEHPGIPRVHDAGLSSDGRPYFVMEHVSGEPITRYAEERRLGIEARLDLLARACDAVEHAHSSGVIHRDLKPSNMLVAEEDGRPVPKIIDFGVAKATRQRLTERTLATRAGSIIGTPEYMSPEQAGPEAGVEVDARSDVYSLGVVLYELLTGFLPFDPAVAREAGLENLLRVIREGETPALARRLALLGAGAEDAARVRGLDPRTHLRRLRGELEWICRKALEKDRRRRYRSPSELAEDIRRYLRGEALSAGAPTTVYRLRKLLYRRRHQAAAAGVLALLGIALLALLVWQAREGRARRAAESALEECRRAEALLAEGQAEEATAAYRRALESLPLHAAAWLRLAPTLEGLGRHAEAIQAYTRLLVLARDASTLAAAAEGCTRLLMRKSLPPGPWLEPLLAAVEACARRGELEPSLAPMLESLAGRLLSGGERQHLERVLPSLERLIPEPEKAARETVETLARLQTACGRGREAVRTIERALGAASASWQLQHLLVDLRGAIAPDLASPASVDAMLSEDVDEARAQQPGAFLHSPSRLRAGRVIRALERIGGAAGREGLEAAAGADWPHDVRALATAALERLLMAKTSAAADGKGGEEARRGGLVGAEGFYRQDFDGEVGPEWFPQLSVTRRGRRHFLGEFSSETVTLRLEGLPPHALVELSLDFLSIRSWDGNSNGYGPDLWSVVLGDGREILRTTFAAVNGPHMQAFPDDWPGGCHPAGLGATGVKPLGYDVDAVFPVRLLFQHSADRLELRFSASGLEDPRNESWGIDNVSIRLLPETRPLEKGDLLRLWENLKTRDGLRAGEAVLRLVEAGEEGARGVGLYLREGRGVREEAFAGFRALERDGARGTLMDYLEGRLLELAGEEEKALQRMENAVQGTREPEPHVARARLLQKLGRAVEADACLRGAIEAGAVEDPRGLLLEAWFTGAAVDLRKEAPGLLAALPSRGLGAGRRAADLRWLLGELAAGRPLRINCGGEEHRGKEGAIWSADRFFQSGSRFFGDGLGGAAAPFLGAIANTDEDALYQTERWFPLTQFHPPRYRLPLPPGRYRVTLHFAEIYFQTSGLRTFDVLLEGQMELKGYEPLRAGFATAELRPFELDVRDGHLEIEFRPRKTEPKISAIEVELLRS